MKIERAQLVALKTWEPSANGYYMEQRVGRVLHGGKTTHTHNTPAEALDEALAHWGPLRMRAAVLVRGHGEDVAGVVGEDVLVLPHLGVEFARDIAKARGVITELGGRAAHLAILSRERGLPVMLLPNATGLLRPGQRVTLCPARLEISFALANPSPTR